MKIAIDPNIQITKNEILDIINNHPFTVNLSSSIIKLNIKLSTDQPPQESIEFDIETKKATLYLIGLNNYNDHKYILYHEFAHIADKIDINFLYSEIKKDALSNVEKLLVMELWNIYIDSRLNFHGLFQLDTGYGYGTINGKITKFPGTIEGKLMKHVCFLSARNFNKAKYYVECIWGNPTHSYTYDDLINITKQNVLYLKPSPNKA